MSGNWLSPNGLVNPQSPDFQAQYSQTLRSLQQLQQQVKDDPNMGKDIADLVNQMKKMDPYAFSNDPLLAERIQGAVMAGVEQVELQLRRKVEDTNGGNIRSQGTEKIPAGYTDAIAEYRKKLSKSGKQ